MKLFTTRQIAELDRYTIDNEPIEDIDLMERAALQVTRWIIQRFTSERKFIFFAGTGNNGGDAMAVARLLAGKDYSCELFLMDTGKELQGSPAINWQRLVVQNKVYLSKLKNIADFPATGKEDIIVEGLFGAGLSRPLHGFPAMLVQKINSSGNTVIAIDIPAGLMGEDNQGNNPENIIQASYTLTFQFPKIAFLLPGSEKFTGKWEVLPIGLHPGIIDKTPTPFYWVSRNEISAKLIQRSRFSHKGTYGHALLVAGSYGKMGAAVLASEACLRTGAGLLTTHVPKVGYSILQTAVPEAMADIDDHEFMFTGANHPEKYEAVGIGPGIGTRTNTQRALFSLLENVKKPVVLDADALNILSEHPGWMENVPEQSVLTPHPGEFKRLAGESGSSFDMIKMQMQFAQKYKIILVLKGAHTSIASPDGKLFFNSSGNPGMATAGSGDVLTGIVLGLLAQGYAPLNAALAAVYLHGLAGDLAAEELSMDALIAGDIIRYLGKAFLLCRKEISNNTSAFPVNP